MKTQFAPGFYYEAVSQPAEPSPLRSDVAGFLGRTARGPSGKAVRITGWREFQLLFGGLLPDADTPHAVQGYFTNGGEVAYVVRLLGSPPGGASEDLKASACWDLTKPEGNKPQWQWDPVKAGFPAEKLEIKATSPGVWANGLRISARYRQEGASGRPELDLTICPSGEIAEYLVGIDPANIAEQVNDRSNLISIVDPGKPGKRDDTYIGPRLLSWPDIILKNGLKTDQAVSIGDYNAGLQVLLDEQEAALIAFPDLPRDLGQEQAILFQQDALADADALLDRQILLDLPAPGYDSIRAKDWSATMRLAGVRDALRSGAAYHPWVNVKDPFGGTVAPLRSIPPCGHVAGLISLFDRERGAHYTPANATLTDVLDVTRDFTLAERAALNEAGVNLLRCWPGRGVQVWGGRTLYPDPERQEPGKLFLAHRRLIHRLVRAIRRVAEPLVFEPNGPVLWLTLTRAITTILVAAYRGGGLKGNRPEEAFRVRCDAANNPPEAIERSETLCEIDFAPATPMEFITLRVSVSANGTLDVFEK